jgi:hypothetical protein
LLGEVFGKQISGGGEVCPGKDRAHRYLHAFSGEAESPRSGWRA